jgi:DNA repair protein RecN (Recombination protein N)
MESLKVEAVELMRDLDHEVDRVQEDPEREQFLRNWLDEYQRLLTKHRLSSADGLLAKEAEMSGAIEAIQNRDERISELKASVDAAFSQVKSAGKALREVRKTTTKQLEESIVHQLGQLKMKDASLQVVWTEMGAPDAWGLDDVEWLFRSHPTSSFQPLTQVASGGERSRLMLAIKAVQSHHAAPKTIILDEIDTGVSGHVAECMARLMREMSAHQQVISVTHLPQVAGIADHHLQVTKNASTDKVETRVEQLTPDARIQEIAAMLSGAEITPAALQHAEALLASRSI